MGLDDVVSTTAYLRSLNDYAGVNEVYTARFKEPFPVCADLAGAVLLVKVSAIAGERLTHS